MSQCSSTQQTYKFWSKTNHSKDSVAPWVALWKLNLIKLNYYLLNYYEIYQRKRDDCLIALMEYVKHVIMEPEILTSLDQVFYVWLTNSNLKFDCRFWENSNISKESWGNVWLLPRQATEVLEMILKIGTRYSTRSN